MLNMTETQKPHVPTLGTAIIAIIAIVLLYHFVFAKRR